MNRYLILYLSILVTFFSGIKTNVSAQTFDTSLNSPKFNWFASTMVGYQLSGIKSEDFVKSNYSPLYIVSVGKWFSPELAIQFGYRGRYFNTIADIEKHHYNYFFGDVIFDVNRILLRQHTEHIYKLYLHLGSGYFYNIFYGQPNICASVGISNNFILHESLALKFDITAIMGWDIYQGDEDILPGLTVGVSYNF